MNKTTEALKLGLKTAEAIAAANWKTWEELATPEEFERWVKSRANHLAASIRDALADPVKQEPVRLQFPTMLRKMWSGTEVQQWLDEQVQPVKQEPVAWHEPNAYGNVTTHKKWAEENGWLPLYTKE